MNLPQLISLSQQGLTGMFDADEQMFCHRIVHTARGLKREGISLRYTMMTLLGLRALEEARGQCIFDTSAIYESLVRDMTWIPSAGDLGLFLWLVASFTPERAYRICEYFDLDSALDRYEDGLHGRTTEMAWFLAGVSHAAGTSSRMANALADVAAKCYQRIQDNQGEYGLFSHLDKASSISGIVRGRIGSFADQVYPIYAMTKFATIFDIDGPIENALRCAEAICNLQGQEGQWWWLYDSTRGHVSSHYPVYSVHQDGMAPMALLALEKATGRSFERFVNRGLNWICGTNELNADMRSLSDGLIWRCILPKNKLTKYWEIAKGLIRSPDGKAPAMGRLQILFEDRPYELGWLLYALSSLTS